MDKSMKVLVVLAVGLTGACTPALKLTPTDADVVLSRHALQAPDPGQPGPRQVLTLYYGSGTDKNRPEYREPGSRWPGTGRHGGFPTRHRERQDRL